jgi:hypothetical protein
MSIEKAAYRVLLQEDNFELRLYEPMVVVTSKDSDLAGGNGFNRLFDYISGNNKESQKISMTAPVIDSLEGQRSTTSFVMPKQFSIQDVPLPEDPALQPREVKERQVATIRFAGTINAREIEERIAQLNEWLAKKELRPVGAMELARYNAPYVPSFARRNELMVEVETKSKN